MGLGRIAKRSARVILHQLGGLEYFRYRHSDRLRILYYHRFSTLTRDLAAEWEAHCRYLRAAYTPISLPEAAVRLRNGDPLPKNAVVVTVDDGYRDFARIAHPVLQKYGIPATVYLIGDFMDSGAWVWWDQVIYALAETAYTQCAVSLPTGTLLLRFPDAASRWTETVRLCEALKRLPNAERVACAARFPAEVGVTLPAQRPAYYEPLTWDEARRLSGQGVTFGAHTMSHPILPRVEEAGAVRAEILGSKRLLEDRLQQETEHFCYPNGDFDDRSREAVREAGFLTTVTCRDGFVDPALGLLDLNRMSADLEIPEFYLREALAGVGKP